MKNYEWLQRCAHSPFTWIQINENKKQRNWFKFLFNSNQIRLNSKETKTSNEHGVIFTVNK